MGEVGTVFKMLSAIEAEASAIYVYVYRGGYRGGLGGL